MRGPRRRVPEPARPTETPWQLSDRALHTVMDALAAHGVPAFVVRTEALNRHCIGIYAEHRAAALEALSASLGDSDVRARALRPGPGKLSGCDALTLDPAFARADVIRVGRLHPELGGPRAFSRACDVEFWREDVDRPGVRVAPRGNVAAQSIAEPELALCDTEVGGRVYGTPRVFTRRMLEDIDFPVDVVYAWVDGDDPAWRAKRDRTRDELGLGHPSGDVPSGPVSEHRFRSRDELRYSMRSLHAFAPWVRHVFLVTDDQVPDWLHTTHPGLRVISHAELFRGAALPTFNSNVISSYLHRIEGLSEQFLYFNDDVFLARDLHPRHFFTPAGQARVFPSAVRRPFGEPSAIWSGPENVALNIRRMLEQKHGVTLSRGVRHTPMAMVRSELARLEEMFPEEYAATRSHQFRDQQDIAPGLLFHYHAQIVGLGVASSLDYQYVNLGDADQAPRLERLLRKRDRDVFCLNDVDSRGEGPIGDEQIQDFLDRYYPVPSPYER